MNYTVYKNDFTASIRSLCIYCIYLHNHKLPRYVLHYIEVLRKAGYETIVVSHSPIEEEDLLALEEKCCGIVVKENFGYDFFAWRQGLNLCEEVADLDNLLLTNDSIIGPFTDLNDIFDSMNKEYDFWGLTENYEHKYHIQSYFLHANRKVIASQEWIDFWDDLKLFEDKLDIVKNYEVNLTQALLKNRKLQVGAWVSTNALAENIRHSWFGDYPDASYWHGISNPTVRFWRELLSNFHFPFIKKNLFFDKEHYHVVQHSNTYEYKVFPIDWKKTVEKAFHTDASALIGEFMEEYNAGTRKFEHYIVEKYKLLFIYDQFREPAQIDYLVRLLQFFNENSIETEVILSSSEDLLDKTTKSALRDLTKLTFFEDLNKTQTDIHKHQLACEKIGAIFLGNVTVAKFAAGFAYITCPYVLMINQGAPDIDLLRKTGIDIGKENIVLMTHSKRIKEWLSETGLDSHLIDFFPEPEKKVPNIPGDDTLKNTPLFNLGFIGFANSESNYEQISRITESVGKKGGYRIFLLFNTPEYEHFKELVKKNGPAYESFLKDSRCKIIVYEDLNEVLNDNHIDFFISYYKPGILPKEYTILLSEQKPFFNCYISGANEEILGSRGDLFSLDYFDVPGITEKIALLKENASLYQSVALKQSEAFRNYRELFQVKALQEFFFTKVIDFTELKSLAPKISVIFHFHFYSFDDTTFLYYKKRLREFYKPNVNFLFSITEDSYEIPRHVASLQRAFPDSIVKIVPNKGRDIGAKFILLDSFLRRGGDSEYVVVLHDKKSLHLPYWEAKAWIDSLLKIIDPRYYQSIIGSFTGEQKTGIIGSSERIVDCILRFEGGALSKKPVFEWNNDLLHYMIAQYNIRITDYNFVGGTMFWVKGALLKDLNEKYHFLNEYRKLEEGNVMDNNGSTITHCWERLFCWLSTNSGYKIGRI